MNAVPEEELTGILAEGVPSRIERDARLRHIGEAHCRGRGDDFIEDAEHVQPHHARAGTGLQALKDRFQPGVELNGEELRCTLRLGPEYANRRNQAQVGCVRLPGSIPRGRAAWV
jgi:hypothetical protein